MAKRSLGTLAGFVLVGAGIVIAHGTFQVSIPCPFRELTGWLCPLCGTTRAMHALLHADIAQAWRYNPIAVLGAVILAILGATWIFQVVTGRRVAWLERLQAVRQGTLYVLIGVVAVVFTVVRNLV